MLSSVKDLNSVKDINSVNDGSSVNDLSSVKDIISSVRDTSSGKDMISSVKDTSSGKDMNSKEDTNSKRDVNSVRDTNSEIDKKDKNTKNKTDNGVNGIMEKCADMDELSHIYSKELIQQRERIQKIKKKLNAYNKNIEEHEGVFKNFVKCTDGFINHIVNFLENWSYSKSFPFLSDCKKVLQNVDSTEINLTNDDRYNTTCYDMGTNRIPMQKRRGYTKSRSKEMYFNKTYAYGDNYKSKSKSKSRRYRESKHYSSSSSSSVSNRYSINNRFNNYNIYNISNHSRRYQEEPRRSSYRETENIFDLSYPYDTIEIKELYEIYKQKKININFQNTYK